MSGVVRSVGSDSLKPIVLVCLITFTLFAITVQHLYVRSMFSYLRPANNTYISSRFVIKPFFTNVIPIELGTSRSTLENTTLTAPCTPSQRVVFLKTHKTASTTTSSIFERYGYYRNLTFAVGKLHVLSFPGGFSHRSIMNFPGMRGKPFDMLTNHARYNRKEMDLIVPNATYVTIIRRPEDQLESAFGYFEMYRGMNLSKLENPFKHFLEDPMKYYRDQKYHMWHLSRNGQLFDLGLELQMQENKSFIKEYIDKLDKDFDLVMLSEYYDESLVLMRKLLCWDFEDIVYISAGVRSSSHRFAKDEDLLLRIKKWNMADYMLYDHFNRSFWQKVKRYGSSFTSDLEKFRALNKAVFQECIDPDKQDRRDRREDKYVLKNHSERCVSILRADVVYTPMIRTSMIDRFGLENGSWIPPTKTDSRMRNTL